MCPAAVVALLASSAEAAGPAAAHPDRPNIVLIVLDTLRADRVGPRLDRPSLTPFLDDWSEGAVVFHAATTPVDHTSPSHFSMLTGLPPSLWRTSADRPARSVIAELNAAGYDTIGISANPLVDPAALACAAPFQTFVPTPSLEPDAIDRDVLARMERYSVSLCPSCDPAGYAVTKLASSDRHVNNALKRTLDACPPRRPVFLFLNFLDAHDPYMPSPASGPSVDQLQREWPVNGDLRAYPTRLSPKEASARGLASVPDWQYAANYTTEGLRFLRELYDGDVRDLDRELARTFAILEAHGVLRDAIVVVTSDHGEALGERGYLSHGLVSQGVSIPENLDVPLRIRAYGRKLRAASSPDAAASTQQIADSIRAWAGLSSPGSRRAAARTSEALADFAAPEAHATRTAHGAVRAVKPADTETRSAPTPQDEELARRLRSLGYLR